MDKVCRNIHDVKEIYCIMHVLVQTEKDLTDNYMCTVSAVDENLNDACMYMYKK